LGFFVRQTRTTSIYAIECDLDNRLTGAWQGPSAYLIYNFAPGAAIDWRMQGRFILLDPRHC
jgi:hypothetical protein